MPYIFDLVVRTHAHVERDAGAGRQRAQRWEIRHLSHLASPASACVPSKCSREFPQHSRRPQRIPRWERRLPGTARRTFPTSDPAPPESGIGWRHGGEIARPSPSEVTLELQATHFAPRRAPHWRLHLSSCASARAQCSPVGSGRSRNTSVHEEGDERDVERRSDGLEGLDRGVALPGLDADERADMDSRLRGDLFSVSPCRLRIGRMFFMPQSRWKRYCHDAFSREPGAYIVWPTLTPPPEWRKRNFAPPYLDETGERPLVVGGAMTGIGGAYAMASETPLGARRIRDRGTFSLEFWAPLG